MLFLKMAGSIAIISAAFCMAIIAGRYEKKLIVTLDGFWELINFTKNKIDISLLPGDEILRLAKGERFGIELDGALSFEEVVRKNQLYLNENAASELLSFASGFGEARREEQIKRCERCASVIDSLRTRAREEISQRTKIKRTLIISLALCIILVLW